MEIVGEIRQVINERISLEEKIKDFSVFRLFFLTTVSPYFKNIAC
jgi:hypothetical protein